MSAVGWSDVRIGDVCKVIAGQSPEGSSYNKNGEGLPFYQGKKEFTEKYLGAPTTWTTQVTKEAEAGDILMSVRAPVGPINFSTDKICIGRGLAAIRAGKNIDREYLFYVLRWKQPEISGNEGAVFASINKKQIEDIDIPLPSISEQKRIVAILDEAFVGIETAIGNTEKNLANVRELFESYLNRVFTKPHETWSKEKLCGIIDIAHGFAFKSEQFHTSDDDRESIVLTPGNYTEHGELCFNSKNTKRLKGAPPKDFKFKKGDLTVVMTDLSPKMKILGKPAFIPEENILHNQRIGRIIFNVDAVRPRYLYYFLLTETVLSEIRRTATGTMVRHTAPKRIKNIDLPFPKDLSEQDALVHSLDRLRQETRELEAIYQRKLASLTELKQSLLQKAFSGELTVEMIDEPQEAVA